jgi:hypothetical protein
MVLRPTILNVSFSAIMLSGMPAAIPGQALPLADGTGASAGRLSEPFRSATYMEEVGSYGREPNWNYGYLARPIRIGTPGSADVAVYDRDGKHVIEARIWFPEAAEVFLFDATPVEGGKVLASGFATTRNGTFNFVAKTDTSGNVMAMLNTETLSPARVCEQPDGTVWVFGRDSRKDYANDKTYSVLRQYSFEGDLLHSYLSRDSIELHHSAIPSGRGQFGSFLDCGKRVVSLYTNLTSEFVQVDADKESMQRWEMDMSPLTDGRVTGLGVTESGHIYASLYELKTDGTKVHGLFELQAEAGKPEGRWIPVAGTLNSFREGQTVPQNTFWRLWGADGEDLVIGRQYDPSFSWVRVVR